MLVGALARLPLLAGRPLWFDEIQTLEIAKGPVLEKLATADRMPPAHALVVSALLHAGDDEWLLRLPSFLAGVASIAVAFVAGKRWSSARAGVILAALVAISPPFVFYSREARPYSLGLLAIFALLAAAPGRGVVSLALASAASVLTLWTSAVVVFFVQLAVARRDRRTLLALGGTALLVLPAALLLLPAQLGTRGAGGGFLESAFYRPGDALSFARANVPALGGWVVCGVPAPIVALLLAVCAFSALGRGRLVLVALGPFVALLAAAGLHAHPFGPIRHCLPLAPGLFLLAACGLDALGRRANLVAALLAALLVGAAGHGLPKAREWYFEDVPGILEQLRVAMSPGDKLYVEAQARPMFAHKTRRQPWPAPVATNTEWLRSGELAADIERAFAGTERLWVVFDHSRIGAMAKTEALLHQRGYELRARLESHSTRATLWVRRRP